MCDKKKLHKETYLLPQNPRADANAWQVLEWLSEIVQKLQPPSSFVAQNLLSETQSAEA